MRTSDDRRLDTLQEKVETLTGERAGGARRAIRNSDLATLRKIKVPEITARYAAGAAPTKAEHDALVDDVRAMRLAIQQAISSFTSIG